MTFEEILKEERQHNNKAYRMVGAALSLLETALKLDDISEIRRQIWKEMAEEFVATGGEVSWLND